MRFGFVALGLGLSIDALYAVRQGQWPNCLFLVFGVSMVLVAVFSHRPINPELNYDLTDDMLHSFFSPRLWDLHSALGWGGAWFICVLALTSF